MLRDHGQGNNATRRVPPKRPFNARSEFALASQVLAIATAIFSEM